MGNYFGATDDNEMPSIKYMRNEMPFNDWLWRKMSAQDHIYHLLSRMPGHQDVNHYLIKNNKIKTFKDRLCSGLMKPDDDTISGYTYPLIAYATIFDKREIMKLLIMHKCDVNKRDCCYVTPLMKAAALGKIEAAQILIEAGADVNQKDQEGNDYQHYAILYDKTKFIATFTNFNEEELSDYLD